ncbi:MAG: AbgT family transporter, partial [Phycisphaerales bacterium]|nr:AbgT family transporter [Phycisphaerales bacterium]
MTNTANRDSDLRETKKNSGVIDRFLNFIEVAGNKLPDPAVLFLLLMAVVWLLSWPLSLVEFGAIHPITKEHIAVIDQVTGVGIANLLTSMVETFVNFAPLGVVLVALLGIGVAEHTGLISVVIKTVLGVVPKFLLTPTLILVGIGSHYAVDAGYVLVIPIGGVIFYAAGRHPLAGIAAAFAGVSGGFSANFWIPSGLDPLLQGFTLTAAQLYDPDVQVSIVNNNVFTAASTMLIVIVGWFITDRIIEPRVAPMKVDGDPAQMPTFEPVKPQEIRGMIAAIITAIVGVVVMVWWGRGQDSALRFEGSLLNFRAPLMQSIVPLIFLFAIIPAIVHGYVAGTVKSHKDIVKGMSKAMETMAYYIVLAFFCSLFIWMFSQTNIGLLLAIQGAGLLKALGLPGSLTIFGIVILVGFVNLLVGSASAKWALISAVFVPMLMDLGISPDLTQAAYRVGDSSTNIITPLMPYFPLVVVFCQRYVKSTGIGTLVSLMLPYSIIFL